MKIAEVAGAVGCMAVTSGMCGALVFGASFAADTAVNLANVGWNWRSIASLGFLRREGITALEDGSMALPGMAVERGLSVGEEGLAFSRSQMFFARFFGGSPGLACSGVCP